MQHSLSIFRLLLLLLHFHRTWELMGNYLLFLTVKLHRSFVWRLLINTKPAQHTSLSLSVISTCSTTRAAVKPRGRTTTYKATIVNRKWTLTGWGRRTGSASPPASPSGRPAGSCGRTAPSRTCSRFLQREKGASKIKTSGAQTCNRDIVSKLIQIYIYPQGTFLESISTLTPHMNDG